MTRRPTDVRPRPHALIGAVVTACLALFAFSPGAGAAPATTTAATMAVPNGIVVKVATGRSITEITKAYPVTVGSTLLQSRGIYLLTATRSADRRTVTDLTALAKKIASNRAASYAEPNFPTVLNSNRYHSWPEGAPTPEPGGSSSWLVQPALTALHLDDAHAISQGLGVKVAVLDTGIDKTHPALLGRTTGGYDYVDDDADPTDVARRIDSNANGTLDDAYGHGTFVSGLLAVVAPDARVMPMRVLDSDGVGNVYVVTQAIMDAADAGAKVINISFGTDSSTDSAVLSDAIATVQARGVTVVAAAGNAGSTAANYPAADPGVLSVSATDGPALASWANRGGWVKVAAPGDSLIGPVPGGVYADWSGTSMATPIVAGQIALLKAVNRSATPAALVSSVTTTSRPLSGTSSGTVDLVASLHRGTTG